MAGPRFPNRWPATHYSFAIVIPLVQSGDQKVEGFAVEKWCRTPGEFCTMWEAHAQMEENAVATNFRLRVELEGGLHLLDDAVAHRFAAHGVRDVHVARLAV